MAEIKAAKGSGVNEAQILHRVNEVLNDQKLPRVSSFAELIDLLNGRTFSQRQRFTRSALPKRSYGLSDWESVQTQMTEPHLVGGNTGEISAAWYVDPAYPATDAALLGVPLTRPTRGCSGGSTSGRRAPSRSSPCSRGNSRPCGPRSRNDGASPRRRFRTETPTPVSSTRSSIGEVTSFSRPSDWRPLPTMDEDSAFPTAASLREFWPVTDAFARSTLSRLFPKEFAEAGVTMDDEILPRPVFEIRTSWPGWSRGERETMAGFDPEGVARARVDLNDPYVPAPPDPEAELKARIDAELREDWPLMPRAHREDLRAEDPMWLRRAGVAMDAPAREGPLPRPARGAPPLHKERRERRMTDEELAAEEERKWRAGRRRRRAAEVAELREEWPTLPPYLRAHRIGIDPDLAAEAGVALDDPYYRGPRLPTPEENAWLLDAEHNPDSLRPLAESDYEMMTILDLQEDWPRMPREVRAHLIENEPDSVASAGVALDDPHGEAIRIEWDGTDGPDPRLGWDLPVPPSEGTPDDTTGRGYFDAFRAEQADRTRREWPTTGRRIRVRWLASELHDAAALGLSIDDPYDYPRMERPSERRLAQLRRERDGI